MKVVKAKTKSKKNNRRFERIKFGNKESANTIDPDLSQLRKPVDISISSLLQVIKLLETGSDEIKDILAYECDIVYECRVCRSLFRSLANFVSHKRVYCKEKFNIMRNRQMLNINNVNDDRMFIIHSETTTNTKSKENINSDRMLRSQSPQKGLKKDLTSIVDMLQKRLNVDSDDNDLELRNRSNQTTCITADNEQILLETMESNRVAMYQTVVQPSNENTYLHSEIQPTVSTVHTADLMKAQIIELQNMANRNTAVLDPDGQLIGISQTEKSDDPLQIYRNDDVDERMLNAGCMPDLICSICHAKFATKKTLTFHMKSLHMSYRMCYPCPFCSGTFRSTWSVYRHLFKVHRKTNEQVRKLRTQILEKAFRKKTTGAEDLEKESELSKSVDTVDHQVTNETQEWMEHLESDLELQRCGGCGRRFDRRAALLSHSQFCQRRIAACSEVARDKAKKCVKVPLPENVFNNNNTTSIETSNDLGTTEDTQVSKQHVDILPKSISLESNQSKDISIHVDNVSSLSKADWDMIGITHSGDKENIVTTPNLSTVDNVKCNKEQSWSSENEGNNSIFSEVPDSPEIIYASVNKSEAVALSRGSKKRKVLLAKKVKASKVAAEKGNDENPVEDFERVLNFEDSIDHVTLMENKIATIANLHKLRCLPCNRKFTTMTNLRRHLAAHIGWNRYRCRLCDFKCFVKCDCVNHCNRVHNAENKRSVIADMVEEIPHYESIIDKDTTKSVNTKAYTTETEVIDITKFASSVNVNESSQKVDDDIVTDKSNTNAELQDKEKMSSDVACVNEENNTVEIDREMQLNVKPNKRKTNIDKRSTEGGIQRCRVDKNNHYQDMNYTREVDFNNDEYDSYKNGDDALYQADSRLDTDPDLRRMVMEVIFGSSEINSLTEPVADQTVSKMNDDSEKMLNNTKDEKSEFRKNEVNKDINIMKEKNALPHRSARNRVKPVNKDFIYDLKDIAFRKEPIVYRGLNKGKESFTDNKMSSKKALVQLRDRDNKNDDVKVLTDRSLKSSQLLLNNKIPAVVIYRANDISGTFTVKKSDADSNTEDIFITSGTQQ